jgi:carnosine N-methyltransferase
VQVIYNVLEPGGFWVNCGPLLYHWAQEVDAGDAAELSLELPLDTVMEAAQQIGFRVVRTAETTARYLADSHSLYQTSYTCACWVLQKP